MFYLNRRWLNKAWETEGSGPLLCKHGVLQAVFLLLFLQFSLCHKRSLQRWHLEDN